MSNSLVSKVIRMILEKKKNKITATEKSQPGFV